MSLEPFPIQPREFLVEVYGPLFAAVGRLVLPSPVRLSDFVNEREGFLRLRDVEFLPNSKLTAPKDTAPVTEYLINKSGIELIWPPPPAPERQQEPREDHGRLLWQAFGKMTGVARPDLRVAKEPFQVQVHTDRFIVSAKLHLARGATADAMLSHLPSKFVPVTDATARFVTARKKPIMIERKLILVNRDHILLVELDNRQRARAAA